MSLKKIIRKNLSNILSEEGIEDGQPDLKYYAFDWDDNIVTMPTQIMLLTDDGHEVGMSTEDFAEYQTKNRKGDLLNIKVNYCWIRRKPLRNFGVEGDKRFIVDSLLAEPGPSWR